MEFVKTPLAQIWNRNAFVGKINKAVIRPIIAYHNLRQLVNAYQSVKILEMHAYVG